MGLTDGLEAVELDFLLAIFQFPVLIEMSKFAACSFSQSSVLWAYAFY